MEVFERLAVELHRQYRAAEKALTPSQPGLSRVDTNLRHDHGWAGCHKQKYFQARARIIIKRAACWKPETLGQAEQALDNTVLMRRLGVEPERHTDRFSRTVGDFDFLLHDPTPFKLPEGAEVTGLSVSYTAIPFPIEEICALFHEILVTGNTGDARRKAVRDKKIRETLWPEKKSPYVITNAIAGPQTGRGVSIGGLLK